MISPSFVSSTVSPSPYGHSNYYGYSHYYDPSRPVSSTLPIFSPPLFSPSVLPISPTVAYSLVPPVLNAPVLHSPVFKPPIAFAPPTSLISPVPFPVLQPPLQIPGQTLIQASPVQNQAQPVLLPQAVQAPPSALKTRTTPEGLKIEDVVIGTGPEARSGQTVTVHYTGTLYPGGEKFDSSLDRQEPFDFELGAGQVIQGWDLGVKGMKIGGKRTLIIPAKLAYGEDGSPPKIPPNATLKFEIELLGLQ